MKKRLFLTWVTHNSRYSEKMKLLKIPKKEWYCFEIQDRILIYTLIYEKLESEWIHEYTLNVLSDHVHLVLTYEEEELSTLIQKIKWFVSFQYSRKKEYSNSGDGRQNQIWAKWYSKTYLDTQEHYQKAIKYTLENHNKHEIPSIYDSVNSMI